MRDDLVDLRFRQLIRSPGGCSLLVKAAASGLTPSEIVEPVTALHLVAQAVGELIPWNPAHDRINPKVREEAGRHLDLARALVREPGIEQWWAPLDRMQQGWLEPEFYRPFPAPDTFPTPRHPPTRNEYYAHCPEQQFATSTRIDGWTSQLAAIANHVSDWNMNYPARRKLIRVSPGARVLEIISAEDWHALVVRHGVRSDPDMAFQPDWVDVPWGAHDGLVPDWRSVAQEWDGVHITPWAFLMATQVRITSGAGWSEPWAWEGEETTWLRWVFDAVEDLPPVDPMPEGRHFPFPFRQHGEWIVEGDVSG